MLLYGILSLVRLKRQLGGAVNIGDNIYEAANLKTPFVIGLLHSQIFIPAGLAAEERRYIILHEQIHIRRHDPAIKILAYFILSLHWFNPFAWLAFLLMSADMEMSCDERVVEELGGQIKTAYSRSLIRLAADRPILSGSPLAFGEGGMKERINNVLNFKKPSRFIIISTVILVAALGLGLFLSRNDETPMKAGDSSESVPLPEKAGSEKPAKLIRDELIAVGYKIIDVREYGERFIEHSTITSPAGNKTKDNEVVTIYAEYEDRSGESISMNYTLRRPVSGETGWAHGQPVPWTDPKGQLDLFRPLIPTGEPYSSAATEARNYYRSLGYKEEDSTTIYSVQADYSGESKAFQNKLKDETVTLGVEFPSDPKSHPLRVIVLTRETGGKWKVVRADK